METNNIIKGGKWQTLTKAEKTRNKLDLCLRNFETGPNTSINP